MFDIIIIGMGPSGMSAALYALKSNKNILILDEECPGGLLNKITKLNNYPGFTGSGSDLALNMFKQINDANYKIEKVLRIENDSEFKKVITNKNEYFTKSIIIATGRKIKKFNIVNEEKFLNKGISYCTICDGSLCKNKKVIIYGDNSCFTDAEYLKQFTNDITIILNCDSYDNNLYNNVIKNNITVINDSIVEFIGNDKLSNVKLSSGSLIQCDYIFISSGLVSDTAFLDNINIDCKNNKIVTNENMETNLDGIFACGDIINKNIYQVVTATSEGAIAALSALKYLKK